MTPATPSPDVTFAPGLRAGDACANHWMRQVMLRFRREICWCWHERGLQPAPASTVLPPFTDRLVQTLDQSRFWEEKHRFFSADATARYLTGQMARGRHETTSRPLRGSFEWVVETLMLDDVSTFALALGLTVAFDASASTVIAACLNDQTKQHPTLALVQKLWDVPEDVLRLADPLHPLFRTGLLQSSGQPDGETRWDTPFSVPARVAEVLLFPDAALPHGLAPLDDADVCEAAGAASILSHRLAVPGSDALRVVPVIGAKGSARRSLVRTMSAAAGKAAVELDAAASVDDQRPLDAVATVTWLKGVWLFLSSEPRESVAGEKGRHVAIPSPAIPATVFVAITDRRQVAHVPAGVLLPALEVLPTTFTQRVEAWTTHLGRKAKGLDVQIAECARRFRLEPESIAAVCRALVALPRPLTDGDIASACRAEVATDLGDLAAPIAPRFSATQLVLPHKQHVLIGEIVKAMRSLAEVHYVWGTAKAWSEGGLSVLFAGPPGTGKTMAAEALATELGLPLYRIDLSQVVNKYIGETEKNLKRVFDAADVADMILFFDEADALFGRRTEVSDAHDRYANLEVSYLLERMERFKGLAILATNRKKDLDDAFLRRLRYIVDFPLPDVAERRTIWSQVIPGYPDSSEVNVDFLAEQFPLAGGSIRSVVLNACLQCADGAGFAKTSGRGRLTMNAIVTAIKREYDKMGRTLSLEQYGAYASMVEGLDHA